MRSLYNGPSAYTLGQLQMSVGGPNPGTGSPVQVTIGGMGFAGGDMVWNGSNQAGQWVNNGIYYIKVSCTDPFGDVTTVTKPVNVLGPGLRESVVVFNSAGEVVRKFTLSGLSATVQSISLNLASGQGAVAASVDPVTGAINGGVPMTLTLTNGSTAPLFWDGLGAGGAPLQAGTYLVELVRSESGQSSTVKTLAVSLLQVKDGTAQNTAASAKVAPNPVAAGEPVSVRYTPSKQNWARGRLYNADGELVAEAVDLAGSGALTFGKGCSSGVYLVSFEVCEGQAVMARRVLKAAVVH